MRRGFHQPSYPPTWSQVRRDAAKPLERRRNNGIHTWPRIGREPPPHMVAIRRPAVSRLPSMGVRQATRHHHGRTYRRCAFPPSRIKASLRLFQRWEIKVLGFGVKARPRPQRMALRWDYDPFGLVGANGKACGEASGVSFPGAPPGYWGTLPLLLWCVDRVDAFTGFMC